MPPLPLVPVAEAPPFHNLNVAREAVAVEAVVAVVRPEVDIDRSRSILGGELEAVRAGVDGVEASKPSG
jgi:hypothetical protein